MAAMAGVRGWRLIVCHVNYVIISRGVSRNMRQQRHTVFGRLEGIDMESRD
jgi:hypothetical protein